MSSLLIAGHGYLGQEIGRQARAAGWQVSALSKSGDAGSIGCDLSDRNAVKAFSLENSDFSVAILSASSGRGGPEAYRAVFLEGTRNLLDSFPGAHLLFVSSTSVYHQSDGSLVTEESVTDSQLELIPFPGTDSKPQLPEFLIQHRVGEAFPKIAFHTD